MKGVSRSFYLTIRILPHLMREPVSLGYLLARASDTIADTAEVPADLRQECLSKFLPALKDTKLRDELVKLIKEKFVRYQTKDKEKILLERLDEVFAWYDTTWEWSWEEIAGVLKHIVTGQKNDIQHFAVDGKGRMESAEALELYCYQVAGSVGEFWTTVGYHTNNRFSSLKQSELAELGKNYGKGLQLVNILRDIPEDFTNERCYLPVDGEINHDSLLKEAAVWRKKARSYIEDGLTYAKSLSQRRVRVATVLPALIALRTLDLLDQADWDQLYDGVKVTRKEVRKCIWKALFF